MRKPLQNTNKSTVPAAPTHVRRALYTLEYGCAEADRGGDRAAEAPQDLSQWSAGLEQLYPK